MKLLLCFSSDEEVVKVNENTGQIAEQVARGLKVFWG
jgi:hypothetical protein